MPVEVTRSEGSGSGDGGEVVIEAAARPGDHVRPAGEDIESGQEVFPAGTVLASDRGERRSVACSGRTGISRRGVTIAA